MKALSFDIAFALVFSVFCLPACGVDKVRAANYALALERCEAETSTCEGYVACRKRVAERFGRRYNGRCE